jgi:SpoVK/Ycf46/Vps4 family AAA+-type ATPase
MTSSKPNSRKTYSPNSIIHYNNLLQTIDKQNQETLGSRKPNIRKNNSPHPPHPHPPSFHAHGEMRMSSSEWFSKKGSPFQVVPPLAESIKPTLTDGSGQAMPPHNAKTLSDFVKLCRAAKFGLDTYVIPSQSDTTSSSRKHKKEIFEPSFQTEKKTPEEPVPSVIKRLVNINEPITNIGDMIALIDKYALQEDVEYNIDMKTLHNIKEPLKELDAMIGMQHFKEHVVDQILYYVQQLHIPKGKPDKGSDFMHTVIYGDPGTGKTEIAKLLGSIFSNMGILKKGTFKKVTRADLVAGYLGQTAIKTNEVIKSCLGGVLFIDEAYSLGNSEKLDTFSKECIDTLCEALSANKDNLMVIVAGYEKELQDCFFNCNKGLESRFMWRFETEKYSSAELHKIFIKMVKDIGWSASTDEISPKWFELNKDKFACFGRDMESLLSKTKIAHSRRVFCLPAEEKRVLTLKDLNNGLAQYTQHKKHNKKNVMPTSAWSMYS